jgi:hypothetical protein
VLTASTHDAKIRGLSMLNAKPLLLKPPERKRCFLKLNCRMVKVHYLKAAILRSANDNGNAT